jgi:tetratricopeptide (TPR) repeat protein
MFRRKRPTVGVPVSAGAYEKHLLSGLDDQNTDRQDIRLKLMVFYRSLCRAADAMYYAEQYLSDASDTEERVMAHFVLGQAMEHIRDFESALRFYLQGFELESDDQFYQYFFRNNIGFCLNQLQRYEEAEAYLLEATQIDPSRANAFKNLGLSFQGQGKFGEAAGSFIAAVRTDASDPRALRHLEELVEQHREVHTAIPDLNYHIRKCREAVEYVRKRSGDSGTPVRN